MTAQNFVEQKLKVKIQEDPQCLKGAKIQSKVVVLDVEGAAGGTWTFRFDESGSVVVVDESPASCECTIWMKEATFEQMVSGKLNVPMAFVMRKIKVKGDVGIAGNIGLALQKLF